MRFQCGTSSPGRRGRCYLLRSGVARGLRLVIHQPSSSSPWPPDFSALHSVLSIPLDIVKRHTLNFASGIRNTRASRSNLAQGQTSFIPYVKPSLSAPMTCGMAHLGRGCRSDSPAAPIPPLSRKPEQTSCRHCIFYCATTLRWVGRGRSYSRTDGIDVMRYPNSH